MKKIVVVCALFLLGSTLAVAAPGLSGKKITNSQIVQATQDTTVNIAGTDIFVPKGQTVILGQRENGAILMRGADLRGVKINGASISTKGFSILSYRPNTQVVFLHRGEYLTVTDAQGRTSTVGKNGAISTANASINSDTVAKMKEEAIEETKEVEEILGLEDDGAGVPAFVAATATSAASYELASQNIAEAESEMSPSTPGRL